MVDLLIKPKHHSLSDWEFHDPHGYSISAIRCVSEPSSCRAELNDPYYPYAYLNDTIAPCVAQGKFITWWWPHYNHSYFHIYFRQQTPLENLGEQNGYVFHLDRRANFTRVWRYVGGAGTLLKTWDHAVIPYYVWLRIKLKFWEYISGDLTKTLRIELFWEVDGEWVSKGWVEDSANAFSDSEVNRIGWAMHCANYTYYEFIDDTEVWSIP